MHLIYTLRAAEYYSALIGEEHLAKDHRTIGYDEVYPIEGFRAHIAASIAIDMLSRARSQPFFLSLGFFETHREFLKPSLDRDAKYSLPPAPLPDTPETRRDMGAFKASVWDLDQGIGSVLDALDANGLSENTLVIGWYGPMIPCCMAPSQLLTVQNSMIPIRSRLLILLASYCRYLLMVPTRRCPRPRWRRLVRAVANRLQRQIH